MSERRSLAFFGRNARTVCRYYDETGPLDKRGQPFPRAVCVGSGVHTEAGARRCGATSPTSSGAGKVARKRRFLPVVRHAVCGWITKDEYYKTEKRFLFAVADALHEDYQTIVDAGYDRAGGRPILTNCTTAFARKAATIASGWRERRALNHGLRRHSRGTAFATTCVGSWPVRTTSDVPLRDIVDLLVKVNAKRIRLKRTNPRHEHEMARFGRSETARRQNPAARGSQPCYRARRTCLPDRAAHHALRQYLGREN